MDSDIKKEAKRLSKLHTLKNKSEEYIEHEAWKNIRIRELVRTGNFIDDEEKKFAKRTIERQSKIEEFILF